MQIPINDELYFSPPEERDIPAYVEYMNDFELFRQTLNVPHPYTEKDAKWFVNYCREQEQKFGHPLNFVIRAKDGAMRGGAGFLGFNTLPATAHRDEIGYWVAAPFRGEGIMSAALPVLLDYGKHVRKLTRFDATVYATNPVSSALLVKNGFTQEGIRSKAFLKNGQFIDALLYGKSV